MSAGSQSKLRRGKSKRKAPVIREPATTPSRCYLCGRTLHAEDKVIRVHEAMFHQHCYEADIRRGR